MKAITIILFSLLGLSFSIAAKEKGTAHAASSPMVVDNKSGCPLVDLKGQPRIPGKKLSKPVKEKAVVGDDLVE